MSERRREWNKTAAVLTLAFVGLVWAPAVGGQAGREIAQIVLGAAIVGLFIALLVEVFSDL